MLLKPLRRQLTRLIRQLIKPLINLQLVEMPRVKVVSLVPNPQVIKRVKIQQ